MKDINEFQNIRVIATPYVLALDLTDKSLLYAIKYVRLGKSTHIVAFSKCFDKRNMFIAA